MTGEVTFHFEIGQAEIGVLIGYNYTPGEPEVRWLRNGDPGYPATGPEIEFTSYRVLSINGRNVKGTARLTAWVRSAIEKSQYLQNQIEEQVDESLAAFAERDSDYDED